jgi:excisionase family DNA binding protein
MAAEMLGIGKTKLYELVTAGEIETIKVGKATLIPVRSLEALVERKRAVASKESSVRRRRGRPRISFTSLIA